MKKIFITGTDTDAGKTVLTTLLAYFLRRKKIRVAAFKPVGSGGRADAEKIHAALGGAIPLDEINPWYFRAPVAPVLAARREGKAVRLAMVLRHFRAQPQSIDVMLVEGAGGLLSPIGEDFDSRDLLLALKAVPVIVAPNRLGVVNHLRLTLEALPMRLRRRTKVVLMAPPGPDAATESNAALLAEFFPAERIFTLPWLGKQFTLAAALRNPRVRRTLAKL